MNPGTLAANVLSSSTAALAINAAAANNQFGGLTLEPGETATTFYLADSQFEHLGRRGFTHNPLIKRYVPPADRNVIATQTAALFVDELLRQVKKEQGPGRLAIEVKGDIADTPTRSEIARLEKILDRHKIPVEGSARGNHDGGSAFGVVNMASPYYKYLKAIPLIGRFSLEQQMLEAAGGNENALTQRGAIQAMRSIVHGRRQKPSGPDPLDPQHISTAVHEYGPRGLNLLGTEYEIPFTAENRDWIFHTFWRPSQGTRRGSPDESRFWECLVNYDIADEEHKNRATKVNPFYLQASETARLKAEDGTEYPVYTISIDGLDHRNLIAALGGGVSELQVKLIENFMDRMLSENPRARFKISSHFSAKDLTSPPWYLFWRRRKGGEGREAFRKMLSREEVILYSYGHTHERKITDLNQTLNLGRGIPLMEINVPSLIDFHPNTVKHDRDYHDARALVTEKLRLEEKPDGARNIIIDLEYRGLDREDIQEGHTREVDKELKAFSRKHGYIRAQETVKMLRNRHFLGWAKSHLKRLSEVVTVGLNPFHWQRFSWYWRNLSFTQYAIDNFTVVSTVNMFNEAYHLLAFLESVIYFIRADDHPGELAVRGQLEGLRQAILEERTTRLHQFEQALAAGDRPHELAKFNDLFRRADAHKLSDLLMDLRVGGQARAFAILAGLEASRGEFEFHNKKPTKVPNKVPTITIPVDQSPPGKKTGTNEPDPESGDDDSGELVAAFSALPQRASFG